VKRLKSDQGREYLAGYEDYCEEQGIMVELSAAYTPEQNGRAERLNRTLVGKCRALLIDSGMKKRYWPLAISPVFIDERGSFPGEHDTKC
jgi:transposase InsO family protein